MQIRHQSNPNLALIDTWAIERVVQVGIEAIEDAAIRGVEFIQQDRADIQNSADPSNTIPPATCNLQPAITSDDSTPTPLRGTHRCEVLLALIAATLCNLYVFHLFSP